MTAHAELSEEHENGIEFSYVSRTDSAPLRTVKPPSTTVYEKERSAKITSTLKQFNATSNLNCLDTVATLPAPVERDRVSISAATSGGNQPSLEEKKTLIYRRNQHTLRNALLEIDPSTKAAVQLACLAPAHSYGRGHPSGGEHRVYHSRRGLARVGPDSRGTRTASGEVKADRQTPRNLGTHKRHRSS